MSLSRYDEMFAGAEPRAHWQQLCDELLNASPETMRQRMAFVARQIRENGVTYNIYADPQGMERPWELDPLPLIMDPLEWSQIESAIAQRAELLNRILADIYGDQKMLAEGLLPPALVYGHSGFLRAAHGIRPPAAVHLHLYAADLARAPDGRWWVMADRTQAPSGAGYALEDRLVVSRVFPELFREQRVQHLASFFRTLRDSLAHWSPHDDEAPLVVLLTPGPYNETYFEHAYLAHYLGFPLVEGSDLTVRDNRVWLKTLDGLQRVHAILRRLDDNFSDPLELRADSALGIPGLTQAARSGKVLIANALGSGLLESGALLGFLPALCQRLMGAPLAAPSVATWWCGQPDALAATIAQLDQLVIKPAFPQLRTEPVFGQDLSGKAREELIGRLRATPQNYVAQEWVHLAQAPVWDGETPMRLRARQVGLRVFACASPGGYVVMPGGLTRVAGQRDARVLSMQRGGSSKDTWVLSHGPVIGHSMRRRPIGPQDIVRSGANLSSRVVENLFWFGRYTERCDDIARLLRLTLSRLIEDPDDEADVGWAALLELVRRHELVPAPEEDEGSPQEPSVQLLAAVFDTELPTSLATNLKQLSRVAFQLRERLSLDNWRVVNRLTQSVPHRRQSPDALSEALSYLDSTVMSMMTLGGFAIDGMTRDQGWRFLSVGRRLERLVMLTRTLQHALTPAGAEDLEWLLEIADSIITYRSRYMARPEPLAVFDLLLLDAANPRSVMFQVVGLHDYLKRLGESFGPCGEDEFALATERLQTLDLPAMLTEPTRLSELLEDLADACQALSDQIALRFFSHIDDSSMQTATL